MLLHLRITIRQKCFAETCCDMHIIGSANITDLSRYLVHQYHAHFCTYNAYLASGTARRHLPGGEGGSAR